MEIFEFDAYHPYLMAKIKQNSEKRGYLAKLAEAAGCQRSYLSLVIKGEVHLTPEHAFGLTQFWRLSESESDYFLDLVLLERSSSPALKGRLQKRLSQRRNDQFDLSKRFEESNLPNFEAESVYYSQWFVSAIHVCISIPKLRKDEAIAQKLKLPLHLVRETLSRLRGLNLIERINDDWRLTGQSLHLSRQSLFSPVNHRNWRDRAIVDAQDISRQHTHYTSVQSVGRSDFEKIQKLILNCVDRKRKIVAASPEEELAVFCCDWFKL